MRKTGYGMFIGVRPEEIKSCASPGGHYRHVSEPDQGRVHRARDAPLKSQIHGMSEPR